jgi:hypothetical protein
MPAKKAPAKSEEKQVSKAAFLKSLNSKKAAAKAAAKTERKGFLSDAEIAAKLGLGDGDRMTTPGKVSKIVFYFAKNDSARPAFRFVYVAVSDDKNINGTTFSKNIIIEEVNTPNFSKTEEEAMEELFQEFQGLGDVTAKWTDPLADAVEAAEQHTKDKTDISLSINCFKRKSKPGQPLGIGVYPNPARATDNSDLEDDEEEYEDADETLVGKWVTWTDDAGSLDFFAEAYDEDSDTYSGKDEEDNEYTEVPASECELAEDQGEE